MPGKMKGMAVAWFRAEDYQRIREVCDDEMIPTFAEFEAKMAKKLAALQAQTPGIAYEKVIVDPDDLVAFAKQTGARTIDAQTRSQFAAFLLMKKYGGA